MSAEPSATTLVGVASGTPDGGVAIVRVSGPAAFALVAAVAGALPPPRRLARRRLSIGEDALIVAMPGPGSFTGEDVVELHVHAGARNVAQVVATLLSAGGTPAGAGDFTRRAFAHGRLSLEQAEGIATLIAARTEAELEHARRLVAGELGRAVAARLAELAELRAEIEGNLDFPEDVQAGRPAIWRERCQAVAGELARWIDTFAAGRRARERARIVVGGPTNAGKSSLFNALLGRSRSIVADEPGTTRDYVEAEWELPPHAATLVDTAGIRAGAGSIEGVGIDRARDQLAGADLVLWVEAADAPAGAGPDALERPFVAIESKADLGPRRPGWTAVSTVTGAGLAELRSRIRGHFAAEGTAPWIGLARHHDRAREALTDLRAAEAVLAAEGPLEVVAFHLGVAEQRLGEILGRTPHGPVGAEVLDAIFSRFCVGK